MNSLASGAINQQKLELFATANVIDKMNEKDKWPQHWVVKEATFRALSCRLP